MADNTEYITSLSEALKIREDWLERSELPKMKDCLRAYQTGFASLYNLYMKKGLVVEDPYKQEVKIGELEIPDTSSFTETKKLDQISMRLSNYDTQMDFLVNFYSLNPEFLTIERLKRIASLVKYIDWVHLTPDSQLPNTKAVAEMTALVKQGSDSLTMSVITESLSNLNKQFNPIMGYLKILVDYRKELFKLELRESVLSQMPPAEAAQVAQVKKKFSQANAGAPFYPDLAEEAIKEDYTPEGPALKEKVLASLRIADAKPKAAKAQVSFKTILLDGIYSLGSTAQAFTDISGKMDENRALLENRKKSLWEKVRKLVQQVLNKQAEAVVYELEYNDPVKNMTVHDKVNIVGFKNDLDKKIKMLFSMSSRGTGMSKLESMQDEQLISFLERNIRDLQTIHKTLSALDDFFKAEAGKEDRDKIKGIKPELATIKNAIVRANSKRYEYSAQKEEEEQLRKLGVKPETQRTE